MVSDFWDVFTTQPLTGLGAAGIGVLQGGANAVNGLQNAIIAIPNLVPTLYNNTAGNLGGGTIGYIPSPDWSEGLIMDENYHDLSVFLGGQGLFVVATMGISQIGGTGELVHLTSGEAATSIQAEGVIHSSGGIFAATNPYASPTLNSITTLVADTSAGVPITGPAAGLFQPVVVVGPLSAYESIFAGAQFAPYSQITLSTGEAVGLGFWATYPILIDAAAMQLSQITSQLNSGTL